MDKTKEYQEMCFAAKEIQCMWNKFDGYVGDMCATSPRRDGVYVTHVFTGPRDECHIWLPRQDQLQDIFINKSLPDITIPMLAGKFWNWIYHTNPIMCSSMEILWLQYTMHTVFSKSWNGKEWV